MPTLITEAELREIFDLYKDVASGRVTFAIGAASRRLRSIVGEAVYADALLDGGATDQERRKSLDYAEAHMAMHYAILGLNTQIRARGVVATEKVEGNVTVQYLRPEQIKELAQLYLDEAEEITRPYALTDGVPDAQFEIVETEDE